MIEKEYIDREGYLEIYPEILDGDQIHISILGDPQGLRYLARLLNQLADVDQEKMCLPKGEREHIHLHKSEELGGHSWEVQICRADAKDTGEFPEL